MDLFSYKKSIYIADSEGEEDVLCAETPSSNDVDMHIMHKNISYETKADRMNGMISPESINKSISDHDAFNLRMQMCEEDAVNVVGYLSDEKNTEYKDYKENVFSLNDKYDSNGNILHDISFVINMNDSDDEIQLFGKPNRTKNDAFWTVNDKYISSGLSEESLNDDEKMFKLYQQENSQIGLLSLAACVDTSSSYTSQHKYKNNKSNHLSQKDSESDIHLNDDCILRKKVKRLRRCKTSKENSKSNEFSKIKRCPSAGSFDNYADIVNNTPHAQCHKFENYLSETILDVNAMNSNRPLSPKNIDHFPLETDTKYQHAIDNSISNRDSTKSLLDDTEKYKLKIFELTNYNENMLSSSNENLNISEPLKQIENFETKLDFSISQISEATENTLENVDTNLLNLDDNNKDILGSKNETLTPPMEILNSVGTPLTPVMTPSVLKESVWKTSIKKPCYRVGLSKKAKIESLHSYLKK